MEKIIELCDISSDDETVDDVASTNKISSSLNVYHSPGQSSTDVIKSNARCRVGWPWLFFRIAFNRDQIATYGFHH